MFSLVLLVINRWRHWESKIDKCSSTYTYGIVLFTRQATVIPSLPFPSLPFPSLPFPSLPFPFLSFPSLPFPSLPFPSLPAYGPGRTSEGRHDKENREWKSPKTKEIYVAAEPRDRGVSVTTYVTDNTCLTHFFWADCQTIICHVLSIPLPSSLSKNCLPCFKFSVNRFLYTVIYSSWSFCIIKQRASVPQASSACRCQTRWFCYKVRGLTSSASTSSIARLRTRASSSLPMTSSVRKMMRSKWARRSNTTPCHGG